MTFALDPVKLSTIHRTNMVKKLTIKHLGSSGRRLGLKYKTKIGQIQNIVLMAEKENCISHLEDWRLRETHIQVTQLGS